MKICVAGSRFDLPTYRYRETAVSWIVQSYREEINKIKDILVSWGATEVVSGKCINSPDTFGEIAAEELGLPIRPFTANWVELGRKAGPLRNREMAEYADRVILMWDGESRGSANMRKEAVSLGKDVLEIMCDWRS